MDGPESYHADCTLHSFRESLLLIECQNLQHVVHKRKLLQKNIKKEERKKSKVQSQGCCSLFNWIG